MPTPIIDSHIHLFPSSHLPTLSWYTPDNPLASQHSVSEYRAATSPTQLTPTPTPTPNNPVYLAGYIFIETDRMSSTQEEADSKAKAGWAHVLDEIALLARILRDKPLPDEGEGNVSHPPCLGIVPWAPVPGGPEILARYMSRVRKIAGGKDVYAKVCGVRYLVQDKPAGTMLNADFVEGLKWLGRRGLTFDLGVDARQGGLWQLDEAVEMMERVHGSVAESEQVVIVINHLCKPNLHLTPESTANHPDFQLWEKLINAMSQHKRTYMKLSGAFSELSPDPKSNLAAIIERLRPWTDAVFNAFGPDRIMFGSDWPVCNVGGGNQAWGLWKSVVEGTLEGRRLSEGEKRGVWGGVALRAYGVDVDA